MIDFSTFLELQSADGKMALDVSLEIQKGEIVALYGSSGAGKTTMLRLIAGLVRAGNLRTIVDGIVWADSSRKLFMPVQQRSIGFVFQDFALFPNFTLRENIEYALTEKGDKKLVDELIEALELGSLQHNKPVHLSGGQKQRVALARAIARKPKLLLLDEPLSALDERMRRRLQEFILTVHNRFALTTILVSHHLPEIYRLADRIFYLEKGKITRSGTREEIFSSDIVSSPRQVAGEILSIERGDLMYFVTLLCQEGIVRVMTTASEIGKRKAGDFFSCYKT